MKKSLAIKILENHLLQGKIKTGEEICIKIDQTLTQDSTGTMAYLQLEAMEIEDVKTENSLAYIDHNILQQGFENADDHEFIKSAANKFGITFSKAGCGICHQVQLEQFGKVGNTLLGSDSHTPTGGALGQIAIGAGGLDVAVAMARGFYFIKVPKIFNIKLKNSLKDYVNAKDLILYILGKLSVKGGTGYIMEYSGEGVKPLSVTDRATICNMGAELGATTSIFPSDENTLKYLTSQNRKEDYKKLSLVISPGSATILEKLSENGALAKMIKAGARILESGCGPCIGMGQAPKAGGISLRSFNRNFKGRSGTIDAEIYLASPETCAISAINGYISNPKDSEFKKDFDENIIFDHTDAYFIKREEDLSKRVKETVKGKNIKPFPKASPVCEINSKIIYKAGDGITTDDICPSNARLLPFRSNIEYLSEFAFTTKIDDFKKRAEENSGGLIVAGSNYGQGSSREHAALIPLYLNIKAVIAKSFARIHRSNLINNAILPLEFEKKEDYEKLSEFDNIQIKNIEKSLESGKFILKDLDKDIEIKVKGEFSKREIEILKMGGYINYAKNLELE